MFDIVTDFLKHIAEDASSEHMSLILSQLDIERLKAEARNAVPVLESYVEPVLPFRDVTEEQIEKEREYVNRQYGFVIWSDALYGTDEDCACRVNEDPEQFLGMSEDEVRQISFEAGQDDLNLLKGEQAGQETLHGYPGRVRYLYRGPVHGIFEGRRDPHGERAS